MTLLRSNKPIRNSQMQNKSTMTTKTRFQALMRFLLTNDDGWGTDGLLTLEKVAAGFGETVTVAPSGTPIWESATN